MDGETYDFTSPAAATDEGKKDNKKENAVSLKMQPHHVIEVPHVKQCYHWDCGLACVSMILRLFGKPSDEVYTKDLDFVQCGHSVWTIDLSYILNRHNVFSKYFTSFIGVNETHHNKAFYKQSIEKDDMRVNQLFEKAAETGIKVKKGSVSINAIVSHLEQGNPIIVLVDWSQMACVHCDTKLKACWSCITCGSPPYHGHYIVVSGFDRENSMIFFKNPDGDHDVCCVSMGDFDRARSSDGTDDDIVFIFRSSDHDEQGSQGDRIDQEQQLKQFCS